MRRMFLAAALALLALGAPVLAPAQAQDPIFGTWATIKDDNGNSGHIRIAPCGEKICGVLVQSFDKTGKPFKSENIGKRLIWDMENKGNGTYAGGKVWSPDRNKTYSGKLVLKGDKLSVKGCVFGICREGGVWTRVK